MPRNLVLFDLEWNIGYQPYTFNYHGVQQTLRGEIVEIGAVKIDEDANVLDAFSIHLRPRIFRKLQHHIAKVTGLTQADLDKGEPIVQGLRRFMQWCILAIAVTLIAVKREVAAIQSQVFRGANVK